MLPIYQIGRNALIRHQVYKGARELDALQLDNSRANGWGVLMLLANFFFGFPIFGAFAGPFFGCLIWCWNFRRIWRKHFAGRKAF